mgnify:CR=1 FL=1|tara:strand:+ start:11562 stop:14030 length:2469 start_codon:yes stop_codon:yes gene_type:complete
MKASLLRSARADGLNSVLQALLTALFLCSGLAHATDYSGTYLIRGSQANSAFITASGASVKSNVTQSTLSASLNRQKWRLEPIGSGYYKVLEDSSGLALDYDQRIRGNAHLYPYKGYRWQQWKIVSVGEQLRLVSRYDGKILQARDNTAQANIEVARLNTSSTAQLWQLVDPSSVLNDSPTAVIDGTGASCAAPCQMFFNADASSDSDGYIASFNWVIDNRSYHTSDIIHQFDNAGSYTVKLTVKDDQGASATSTTVVVVTAPAAEFALSDQSVTIRNLQSQKFMGPETHVLKGNVAAIEAEAADQKNWMIRPTGDGYFIIFDEASGLALDYDQSIMGNAHLYKYFHAPWQQWKISPVAGGYLVTSRRDGKALTASATSAGNVELKSARNDASQTWLIGPYEAPAPNSKPIASLELKSGALNCTAPCELTLDASGSSDADGYITAYRWDARGSVTSQQTLRLQFDSAGTFPVKLTVTDNQGASHSTSAEVVVNEKASAPSLLLNQPIFITDRSTSRQLTVSKAALKANVFGSTSMDPSSKWVLQTVGQGIYVVRHLASGLVLDADRNTANNIHLYSYFGAPWQQWTLLGDDGGWNLVNRYDKRVLGLSAGNAIVVGAGGSSSQGWTFRAANTDGAEGGAGTGTGTGTGGVAISLQPVSQSVFSGSSVTFNVSVNTTSAVNYQWRKNGVAIPNAVRSHLSLSGVTSDQSGRYDVVITQGTSSVVSRPADLSVTVNRAATLEWSAPSRRENGQALSSGDVSHYQIYHVAVDSGKEEVIEVPTHERRYDFTALDSGEHHFVLTTVDSKGIESEFSTLMELHIPSK